MTTTRVPNTASPRPASGSGGPPASGHKPVTPSIINKAIGAAHGLSQQRRFDVKGVTDTIATLRGHLPGLIEAGEKALERIPENRPEALTLASKITAARYTLTLCERPSRGPSGDITRMRLLAEHAAYLLQVWHRARNKPRGALELT